jgi:hypothetical protein
LRRAFEERGGAPVWRARVGRRSGANRLMARLSQCQCRGKAGRPGADNDDLMIARRHAGMMALALRANKPFLEGRARWTRRTQRDNILFSVSSGLLRSQETIGPSASLTRRQTLPSQPLAGLASMASRVSSIRLPAWAAFS